jgi:hypothetical protein
MARIVPGLGHTGVVVTTPPRLSRLSVTSTFVIVPLPH